MLRPTQPGALSPLLVADEPATVLTSTAESFRSGSRHFRFKISRSQVLSLLHGHCITRAGGGEGIHRPKGTAAVLG